MVSSKPVLRLHKPRKERMWQRELCTRPWAWCFLLSCNCTDNMHDVEFSLHSWMMHAPPVLHITPSQVVREEVTASPIRPLQPSFPPSHQPSFIQTVRLHLFFFLFILWRKENIMVNTRGHFLHISFCIVAKSIDFQFWIIILATVQWFHWLSDLTYLLIYSQNCS
jgi:hypothetical protein